MTCPVCKANVVDTFDTVRVEGQKYKVFACVWCDDQELIPVVHKRKYRIVK
jgi:hypothetical protein